MPRRLGEIMRLPELIAAVIGFVAGLVWLRRRTLLPAVDRGAERRRVRRRSASPSCRCSGATCSSRRRCWRSSRRSRRSAGPRCRASTRVPARAGWSLGAFVLIGIHRVHAVRRPSGSGTCARTSPRATASHADLHELVDQPAVARAFRRCSPLYVPNHRPVPDLAFWTDTRPKDIPALPAGHVARRRLRRARRRRRRPSCRCSTRATPSRSAARSRRPVAGPPLVSRGRAQPLVGRVRGLCRMIG